MEKVKDRTENSKKFEINLETWSIRGKYETGKLKEFIRVVKIYIQISNSQFD